ncbi:MAG: zinc ribbon domain-containing protein [Clostridia bacterium]|nr:zinc ribbon domain-containing protein [Clostridia bacterium]
MYKSHFKGYRFFRCSRYKRGSREKICSQHYITEEALYTLVLKQLQAFLAYIQA